MNRLIVVPTLVVFTLLGAAETTLHAQQGHLLAVAVEKYPGTDLPPLKVRSAAERLSKVLGKSDFRTTTLVQAESPVPNRPQASARDFFEKLDTLAGRAGRFDTVVVAVTGHGVQLFVPKFEPTETDWNGEQAWRALQRKVAAGKALVEGVDVERHSFYCPEGTRFTAPEGESAANYSVRADVQRKDNETVRHHIYGPDTLATLVDYRRLYLVLNNCPASSKLVVVDACQNLYDTLGQGLQAATPVRPPGTGKHPSSVAFFASKAGQVAYGHSERLDCGVFMHHVIEGLRWAGDRNDDGAVTLAELKSYVTEDVKKYAKTYLKKEQEPSFVIAAGRTEPQFKICMHVLGGDETEKPRTGHEPAAGDLKDRTFPRGTYRNWDITSVHFKECRFKDCRFDGSTILAVTMTDCVLSNVDFSNARTVSIFEFDNCILRNVAFSKESFEDVENALPDAEFEIDRTDEKIVTVNSR